ncbi:MAG: hypothetical protein J6W99_00650 [Bacteroidaceae bacterium]|nr:hypothetical protein [Bacteroidaceae bacterium]
MNTMLENKQFRKALAERYLDADTTIREEQMLAEYYASHQPDEDEMQIAALIRMTHAGASDMIDTADFDHITKGGKPVRMILRWSSVAAAAVILMLVSLHIGHKQLQPENQTAISTMQILEGMEMISKIEVGEIESVKAEPQGSTVVITVKLTDGKERSYSMTCNSDASSLSFTALN